MKAPDVLQRYRDEELPEFIEILFLDVNQRGNFGNTPLHVASVRGRLEEVEALLAAGANVEAKGELDYTPLHYAAGQGHLPVVRRLLLAGASAKSTNDDGRTPTEIAVSPRQLDVVAEIDNWCRSKEKN